MNDLSSTLGCFLPISLEEMDHVKLLDRIDTKYVLSEDVLPQYLNSIANQYNVLVIGKESLHPYETLYFDTPGLDLYKMHHNGKRNRYKLRCRKYVNSGIVYFEIKSKTNTNRTVKKRMLLDEISETLNEPLNKYINTHTTDDNKGYIPVLRVFFDRLTFVNKNANERLTVDLNLRYRSDGVEKKVDNIVIVEVKQEKHTVSPFRELMKGFHKKEFYLSKYCLGISSLNLEIKRNRFKQKINTLTKLGYEIH